MALQQQSERQHEEEIFKIIPNPISIHSNFHFERKLNSFEMYEKVSKYRYKLSFTCEY